MKAKSTSSFGRIFLYSLLGAFVFTGILFAAAHFLFPDGFESGASPASGGSKAASAFLLSGAKAPKPYSEEEREAADSAGIDRVLSFAAATSGTALAADKNSPNSLYSPVSLYADLSLVADAADGDTQELLLGVLDQTEKTLRPMNDQMFRLLASFGSDKKAKDNGELTVANSIWANDKAQLKKAYLEDLAKSFYTSTFQTDLTTEDAGEAVSAWLSQNTGGKQKQNLFEDTKPFDDPVLHFLNALYFHGLWKTPFSKDDTNSMDFHLADKSTVSASFMTQTQENRSFYKGNGFTMAGLDFSGLGSIDFILPDEGTAPRALLEDGGALAAMFTSSIGKIDGAEHGAVTYFIPQFDLSLKSDLLPTVTGIGVESPLTLTTLTDDLMNIGLIDQYNTFAIDETGVEASSVTDASMSSSSAAPENPDEPLELRLNRPFLFVLRVGGGYPLFVGVIDDPTV